MEKKFDVIQKYFRQEISTNREEARRNEQENRQEIKFTVDSMTSSLSRHIMNLSTMQQNQFDINSKNLESTLNTFNENMTNSLNSLTTLQKEKFTELTRSTEENIEKMRITVDEKLQNTLEKRLGESFKMVNNRLRASLQRFRRNAKFSHRCWRLKKGIVKCQDKGRIR